MKSASRRASLGGNLFESGHGVPHSSLEALLACFGPQTDGHNHVADLAVRPCAVIVLALARKKSATHEDSSRQLMALLLTGRSPTLHGVR